VAILAMETAIAADEGRLIRPQEPEPGTADALEAGQASGEEALP